MSVLVYYMRPGYRPEDIGFVPYFFEAGDERHPAEQIAERYAHGGGWTPQEGFTIEEDGLRYKDGAKDRLLFSFMVHGHPQTLHLYECAWLAIVEPDGSFAVSRVD